MLKRLVFYDIWIFRAAFFLTLQLILIFCSCILQGVVMLVQVIWVIMGFSIAPWSSDDVFNYFFVNFSFQHVILVFVRCVPQLSSMFCLCQGAMHRL